MLQYTQILFQHDRIRKQAKLILIRLLEQIVNELNVFIKLFVILYADDTVILADTKEGMQKAMNIFQSYCEIWKLEVNVNKTKVVVLSKGKIRLKYEFKLQNKTLEIVDSYSYLDQIFKYNGNFNETRKNLARQAQQSLLSIYQSIRVLEINVFRLTYSLNFLMLWLNQFYFTGQKYGVMKI